MEEIVELRTVETNLRYRVFEKGKGEAKVKWSTKCSPSEPRPGVGAVDFDESACERPLT